MPNKAFSRTSSGNNLLTIEEEREQEGKKVREDNDEEG